jgi:hypothetical protein
MKNLKDPILNQTHDLPACGTVTQQTAPPRNPIKHKLAILRINIGNGK